MTAVSGEYTDTHDACAQTEFAPVDAAIFAARCAQVLLLYCMVGTPLLLMAAILVFAAGIRVAASSCTTAGNCATTALALCGALVILYFCAVAARKKIEFVVVLVPET